MSRSEVLALRRLGSLNMRRYDRLKERHDPSAAVYHARAVEFYTEAASLITGWRAKGGAL